MPDRPEARLFGVVLDAPDPPALAAFYRELLGWTTFDEDPTWVRIGPEGDLRPGLAVQLEPEHISPTWPSRADRQQMQIHLDIQVDDLAVAVQHAESLGARRAEHQPQEGVRVMHDPVGHVFCLFLPGS